MKIEILNMGIQSHHISELETQLKSINGLSVSVQSFDLFKPADFIRSKIRLITSQADIVIFYWDILARPSKLLLNLSFPVFGLTGMQYDVVSHVKVPLIIISNQPSSYFLHADLVAYARSNGVDAYLAEDVNDLKNRIQLINSPPIWNNQKVCIFGYPFRHQPSGVKIFLKNMF